METVDPFQHACKRCGEHIYTEPRHPDFKHSRARVHNEDGTFHDCYPSEPMDVGEKAWGATVSLLKATVVRQKSAKGKRLPI